MKKTEAISRLRRAEREISHKMSWETREEKCRKINTWINAIEGWKSLSMFRVHPYLKKGGEEVTEEVISTVQYWESFVQGIGN